MCKGDQRSHPLCFPPFMVDKFDSQSEYLTMFQSELNSCTLDWTGPEGNSKGTEMLCVSQELLIQLKKTTPCRVIESEV